MDLGSTEFKNVKIIKIGYKLKSYWKKTKFLAQICQSPPKIVVFVPRSTNFRNFKTTTPGQYSVVRGATLDMLRKIEKSTSLSVS